MKLGGSLARSRRKRAAPEEDLADDAQAPDPKRSGRRSRIGWHHLIGGLVGLAFAGWFAGYLLSTLVFFPAPPPPGDLFEVPDLRGIGLASATERLAGAGLALGAVDSLSHPIVGGGLVLGQAPLPGQVARPEAPVRVTISVGPQLRSVPDVRRLEEDRARIVLESTGFVVDADTVESEEPRGRVIRVSPTPGNVVSLPASVQLLVSAGPPLVMMPFLLGMEQTEAEAAISALGLIVSEVSEVFRFGRDQGMVVEQEPAADTQLRRGASVRLSVGRRGRDPEQ